MIGFSLKGEITSDFLNPPLLEKGEQQEAEELEEKKKRQCLGQAIQIEEDTWEKQTESTSSDLLKF